MSEGIDRFYWRVERANSTKDIGWIVTHDGVRVDHPRCGLKALQKIAQAHNQTLDYLYSQQPTRKGDNVR